MTFIDEDVVVVGNEPVTVRGSFTDTKTGTWYRVEDFNGRLRVVHETTVRPEASGVWSSFPPSVVEDETSFVEAEAEAYDNRFELDAVKGWE